jgi:hypothetical protein
MFGQFVVHLDYMLSAAPACQQTPLDGKFGTSIAADNGVPAFFVR